MEKVKELPTYLRCTCGNIAKKRKDMPAKKRRCNFCGRRGFMEELSVPAQGASE